MVSPHALYVGKMILLYAGKMEHGGLKGGCVRDLWMAMLRLKDCYSEFYGRGRACMGKRAESIGCGRMIDC